MIILMNICLNHSWKVTPKEAVRIQEELRRKLVLKSPRKEFRAIAAADVSYSRTNDHGYAAFLLFSYPGLTLRETASARGKVSFPCIPGRLAFREAPILLQAFSRLKTDPDLILFDGQGTAPPRFMGIAAHVAGSQVYWLKEIISRQPIQRDRDAEFATQGVRAEDLMANLDAVGRVAEEVLSSFGEAQLDEGRKYRDRQITVRWGILHIIEHVCQHLGHMQLTRQLWLTQKKK
jgi:hypothetical protein